MRSSRRASSMIRSNSRLIAASSSGPVDLLHVREHFRLARRLVDLDAGRLLHPPDLRARTRRARSAADQLLVERVDALAEIVESRLTAAPFSHRTYSPARSATSGDAPCSAITLTSALPTTAASADGRPRRTCSGVEMPKPSATGSDDCARTRATSASTSVGELCRARR